MTLSDPPDAPADVADGGCDSSVFILNDVRFCAKLEDCIDLTPQQRSELMTELNAKFNAWFAQLTPERQQECLAESRAAKKYPQPWWKNLRKESWPTASSAP